MILSDETFFKLLECGSGLYYYDMTSTDDQNIDKTNATVSPYSLSSTVTNNIEFYMRADIEEADRARR